MAPSRFHPLLPFLAFLLLVAGLAPARPAAAQAGGVAELIALINELRASQGLAPYVVDPGLMALAQEHSEYQAAIHTSTHQHSDGRDPPDIGVVENVAGGDLGYLDARAAVYEIWADPVHRRTMLGFAEGAMGVGIADDGITAYYTLEVRPAGAAGPAAGANGAGTAAAGLTPIPLVTLVPATPLPDGSIVHTVGYGQTLWAIALAYGIRVEQIRDWNNLAAGSSDIYAGQKLLVLPVNLVTAAPTLPAGPGAQPAAGVTVTPPVQPVASAVTPSPSSSPRAAPGLALARPTQAETPADIQAASTGSGAGPGLLAPILGGASLLTGCALLFILRRNKNLS